MRLGPRIPLALATLAAALTIGCAASPPPPGASAPPPAEAQPQPVSLAYVIGAADSVAPIPGTPGALYRYRFRQIEPGSDRFQFQDRDLSFYMRPTPGAVHLQVENRQDRPVYIDWDRSLFFDPLGRSGKVAHATTTWDERFRSLQATQIPGLQRYSDYVFPMDYFVDPAGSGEQLHRPLLPEDSSAPQFADRDFGVDLMFLIEGQPRTYSFRFKVASVIHR